MTTDPRFAPVEAAFDELVVADPTFSAQLAIYRGEQLVVDLAGGPGLDADSLVPIFSSSKGAIGVVIALLIEREELDLDRPVADYWPEFAENGKALVTVAQLLSHQAGLLGVDGGYTVDELLEHDELAKRLGAQLPLWKPGIAFGYHALTIGVLADELVRRITGRTLADVFREEVTAPRSIDVHLGVGEELDHRVASVEVPTTEEMAAWIDRLPLPTAGSLGAMAAPIGSRPLWELVNEVGVRRVGPPAVGGLATARGLAKLYACLLHDLDGDRLLSDDTIAVVSQVQANGNDIGGDLPARFGTVFQRPTATRLAFGSGRAFGHDGLGGSLAFSDPHHDLSFAYVTKRIPLPGGVDARAIELTRIARSCQE